MGGVIPCPTCSDGIMNCHRTLDGKIICEEGIDCGGPCPAKCERFEPKKEDNLIWYVLITISVVLIVIFTIRMIKMTRQYMIIKKRKEREEEIK